jgi:uncharacterized protein involved in outer membrane biogenesis
VAAAIVVAVAGYVAYLVRALDTPEFQRALLDRVSASVGARVQARTVDVKLLQGIVLEGVTVSNPSPLAGNLATADALVLRYDPWSLLRGRLRLTRLSARRPVLDLAMDGRGVFNYERLGRARSAASTSGAGVLPVALVVSKLSFDGTRIVVRDARAPLVTIDGADLDSSVRLASGLEGEGRLKITTTNLAGAFFVRDLAAPLRASGGALTLQPLRGRVGGGSLGGDATVRFEKGFRYEARLALEGAQLRTLLEEARATQSLSGQVTGEATIAGTGGVETLAGKGQVRVEDCHVARSPLFSLIATVLAVPEIARHEFDECRATFTLGGGRMVNPSLTMKSPTLQLSGRGATSLGSLAIDYDMNLALAESVARRIPSADLRAAFKDRGDGFVAIDFKVTGTTSAPRSDLALRLGRGAAESGIKKFLRRKLFR